MGPDWEDTLWPRWPVWRVVVDEQPGSIGEKIARDRAVGIGVAAGGLPTFRLWVNGPCLVVSRRDVLQGLQRTGAIIDSVDGRPVRVRSSGGTAVPHGPGVLQFSLVIPRVDRVTMDEVYRTLCRPLQRALAGWGWRAEFGHVPGAFCDGAHNLVVSGKKIAGTSQSWKGGLAVPGARNRGYILAHGTLWVRMDPEAAAGWLNDFYEATSGRRPVRAEASTSLHLLPGGAQVDMRDLVVGVADVLRGRGGPRTAVEANVELSGLEVRRGKELAAETDPHRVLDGDVDAIGGRSETG